MPAESGQIRTRVLRVNPSKLNMRVIGEAAAVIKKGGLVAFPTETVYGLGADALSSDAVSKIFVAKGRPQDNPIIVHVSSLDDLNRVAFQISERAKTLIEGFWPGPLTLLFKKRNAVPEVTVAGLDTVAVRMPKHPVALALIRASGTPIAAPSANISGSPSPTTAKHVFTDLNGRIDLILDGGESMIGVESTVLDITTSPPVVLRPGGTTIEQIESCIGEVILHPAASAEIRLDSVLAKSPGMKYKHYAPQGLMVLIEGDDLEKVRSKVQETADQLRRQGKKKVAIIAPSGHGYKAAITVSLGGRDDLEQIARNLFSTLRKMDEEKVDAIVVEGVEAKGLGLAIMNRLRRASGGNIVEA
ncbi:MAG: L-threonylcarbamoyladenylate synthase [Promethearchaeati archaeon SRVP18_Atabeyarchaeia-1]